LDDKLHIVSKTVGKTILKWNWTTLTFSRWSGFLLSFVSSVSILLFSLWIAVICVDLRFR
jgi:hypothetical protein